MMKSNGNQNRGSGSITSDNSNRESGEALRLSKLVRALDSNAEVSYEAKSLLIKLTDEFIKSVVSSACAIAAHRNNGSNSNKPTDDGGEGGTTQQYQRSEVGGATRLELRDLKFVVERLGILVPGFGHEAPVRSIVATKANAAHKERQNVKRKALALMTKHEGADNNNNNNNTSAGNSSGPSGGVLMNGTTSAGGAGGNKLRKTD